MLIKNTNKTKKVSKIAYFLLFFLFSFLPIKGVNAGEISVVTDTDLNSGTKTNLREVSNGNGYQIEAYGTWDVLTLKTPDKTLGVGSAFTSDGNYIYVMRGVGDVLFWRYSPLTNTWDTLANLPAGAYYGSDIQHLNGYIYAFFGGYQNTFGRYSIESNSWELMNEYPELLYQGASMSTDGTAIYAATANNTQGFYKYSVENDTWLSLAGAPATLRAGSDLEHVNGYIYTPRGNNTNTFYRYEISSNTWSTMSNVLGTMNDDVDITSANGYIYVARQNNSVNFMRYEIATDTWETLMDAPLSARYAGVQYFSGDSNIYFFRGNNDTRIWKYNIVEDKFVGPSEAPATLGTGSDMVYVDGYLYTPRGGNTTTFYRYNVSANLWEALEDAPERFNSDVRGFAAGQYIYFFRGSGTTAFFRYSITSNIWETLEVAPGSINNGAALAYPGSGDYIYVLRGNGTGNFWRYSITGNTWDSSIANLPTGIAANIGSTLFSDGTEIYFTGGIGVKRMFKYTILDDSWSELAHLPYSPYYGSDTTYDGNGKVVALDGWYGSAFWEYSISQNKWRKLKPIQSYDVRDIGAYQGASVVSDLAGTLFVTMGGGRQDLQIYTRGLNNFEASGTWLSPMYDLNYIDSWGNMDVVVEEPSDSQVVVQTRTSLDGISWTSWVSISGQEVMSPEYRYLQVKAILLSSSDYQTSPIFHGFTLQYVSDGESPSDIIEAEGFSQEISGEPIESGSSYKFTNPYFTWEPSTDLETEVEGYYVYFGNKINGDPVSEGSYQYGNSFAVIQGLDLGSNYLRIIAKDTLGNLSTAQNAFEYIYDGISPIIPLEIDKSLFSGVFNNSQLSPEGIILGSRSEGFWLEERLSYPTVNIGYGAKNVAYVEDSGKLYLASGMNSQFYEYDLATDTWTRLSDAPQTVYYGGGAVAGPDGYIYVLRGNNSSDFWRYSIANDTWDTSISPAPLTIGYGGSSIFDGEQYIYVLRGNNSDVFWRYDTISDIWETIAKVSFGAPTQSITNNASYGASLAFDLENELIYAIQGNLYSGFSVYDINTDTWTVLPNAPALPYLGASLAFDGDGGIFYISGNYNPYMYRYDIESMEWVEKASTPIGFYYGGGIHRVGDYLYGIRGNNSTLFYRYSIKDDSWSLPRRGLFSREYQGSVLLTGNYGADILKGDGRNFYITRGYYSDDFFKWDESTGELTKLTNLPMGGYLGASLVYDSSQNKIYYTGGQYDNGFFSYDIDDDVWSEEALDKIPIITGAGSSMVYDGSRYIYLTRANNTNTFYRFDTQGSAGSKWSTLTVVPSTLSYGSELLLNGGYIYTLRGNNQANNPFYRYNIETPGWETLSPFPSIAYNDGFLVDGGDGNFYGARGSNTSEFYKYSVSGDSWSTLPNIPAQIYAGGAAESNLENAMYLLTGSGTNSYTDALYTYIMSTQDSGFVREGEYESQIHDLGKVYKWGNLVVDYELNENSNVVIETSTSSDSLVWNTWATVTKERDINGVYSYKIASPTDRYFKIRFKLLSGDGIYTPIVKSYEINYYRDTLEPTNPSVSGLTILSAQESGVPIESETWYNYASPLFTWREAEDVLGASDGANGSGVSGYYVYWGEEEDGDPVEYGTFQEENIFIPSDLEDSKEYYLRVQSVDYAGNLAVDIWAPFIYKYDTSGSVAPSSITADPSGYTSTNSFNFAWESVIAQGAQIEEYCYKTGATEGDFSQDQCTSGTTAEDIPAYKIGTNTFYVRTKDQAGNYSNYGSISYFYVDSEHAPAPPTNLTVTPVNNTANSFGFNWDPPLAGTFYGSQSNLSYLYSVNALPTEYSVSATSLTYLNPGAYATLPGENIFYIVSKDEAGNVNYTDYTSVSFFANTVAPGIPIDIEIADVSVKNTASWKLALSWDAPLDGGSGVSGYQVYRSVDGIDFFSHTFTGGASLVDSKLIQTTYYYKVRACDSTNNCGAFSEMVSLFPDGRFTKPADIIVDPIISGISPKKVTVSWITARTADSKVAYGVEPGVYYEEEVSNSEQVVDHVLTINNLSPGTKYYYVVKWTDEDGNTGISEEASFDTAPPPSIQEPLVRSASLNSALIQFTTKDSVKVRVLYGESSAFGGMIEVYTGTQEGTHNVDLRDLKDGTKYFYKINTFDIDGAEYEGEIHTFETLPRPQILDSKILQVAGTSSTTLLVEWSSNTPVSSIVTYYPSSSPEKALDEVNVALNEGQHRMVLLNLLPNTPYSIIVSGRDFMGNEANSGIKTFVTSADTRAPQIYDLEVSSEIMGAGQEATAQLIVSYKTDELATSQVEFGEGTGTMYTQKSQEDTILSENHVVILSGLTPSKVYHLRALSKDDNSNVGYSVDKVVVTSAATENALDLAIKNLSSIFSFFGR
ncbi:MAG: fibronectin type III domain-containing protein [Candidatus Dojkabacteria bacterium]|jgi:hypothetical protein|nr:fibronectin type III domain-containing protein [Candidatus Dojkabacteria bacterium]